MVGCWYVGFVLLGFLQNAALKTLDISSIMKINDACECGHSNDEEIVPRIVGGEEAKENAFPWMVGIFNSGRMHCGGSMINDLYVLTAGHCLNWVNKEDITVNLHMHDRVLMEQENSGAELAEVEKLIVHEDFSSDFLHDSDDIALIKLKKPVVWSSKLSPVCLPRKGSDFSGRKALVSGWGRTSQSGSAARLLRQAILQVMENTECKKIPTVGEHIIPTVLCAYEKEVDACQGDSGGPFVLQQKGRSEQIGVVSWGIGCAKPGMPGIYTRVTEYLEWIVAHTRESTYCKDPAV